MNGTVRISRENLARLLGAAEARLGAELQDRLLAIPVQDIIERAWILDPPPLSYNVRTGARIDLERLKPVQLPQSSVAILSAVQESPSKAELGDLGFIDAFFGPSGGGAATQAGLPISHVSRFQELICTGAVRWPPAYQPGGYANVRTNPMRQIVPPGQDDPFFCTPQPNIDRSMVLDLSYSGPSKYFAIDAGKPWAGIRPVLLNIQNLIRLTNSYPWPGATKIVPSYWWGIQSVSSGLNDLVRLPGILTQDAARLWVTVSLLSNYNQINQYARDYLEEQAKTERFDLIVSAVGLAIAGAIIGYAVAALVLAAGAEAAVGTAASTGVKMAVGAYSNAQKEEAVAGLTDAAQQLRAGDPAFAGQVQWAATYVQQLLNEASSNAAPRPAPGAPSQGGGIVEAAVGIGLPTLISVGISLLGRKG